MKYNDLKHTMTIEILQNEFINPGLHVIRCRCGSTNFISHKGIRDGDKGKQIEIMQCLECKRGYEIVMQEIEKFHESFKEMYPYTAESFEKYYDH